MSYTHRGLESAFSRAMRPVHSFMEMETAGGILLIVATLVALVWANSPFHEAYHHIAHFPIALKLGSFQIEHSLAHWVNDALMVIFFFVVGLEIKHELSIGALSTPRKAALPFFAAVGGMIFPALIYFAFNHEGGPAQKGWGIPMATDIAFAVGVLILLGKNLPTSLKVFLLAVAIVDDLGAVLVIAAFYTEQISAQALGVAALMFGITFFLQKAGVRRLIPYIFLGIVSWAAILLSGIHATIAGVVLGLMTPSIAFYSRKDLPDKVEKLSKSLVQKLNQSKGEDKLNEDALHAIHKLEDTLVESQPVLERLVHALHPWVTFGIIPLFAFVNAGVHIEGASVQELVTHPIAAGVILGLFFGKPIGVVLLSWIAVQFKLADLPHGLNWKHMFGVGCLAGIGFTMALFISGLALKSAPELEMFSKMGILLGSLCSAIVGGGFLYFLAQSGKSAQSEAHKKAA